MPPDREASAQLATFEAPLAEAVVTVLRREGVPTSLEPLDHQEVEVRVPATRRDEALALLADRMEEIRTLVDTAGAVTATPVPVTFGGSDEEEAASPPLVMDRLRRMGLGVAVVLAPLLVITLAVPDLPLGYALAVFVAGLVAVVYWRNRTES